MTHPDLTLTPIERAVLERADRLPPDSSPPESWLALERRGLLERVDRWEHHRITDLGRQALEPSGTDS